MDDKSRKELELLTIELGELSDVIHVMWLGLQGGYMNMEKALSCIHYAEGGITNFKERIEELINQSEKE